MLAFLLLLVLARMVLLMDPLLVPLLDLLLLLKQLLLPPALAFAYAPGPHCSHSPVTAFAYDAYGTTDADGGY